MSVSIRITIAVAVSSGVAIAVGPGVTVTVTGTVVVAGIGLGVSVSGPLAQALGGPGHVAGAGGVAGKAVVEAGQVVAGLGRPLAPAAEAGGGREGGGDAGPVGVGVVEGGVGRVVVGIGISLGGGHGASQENRSNQKLVHVEGMCVRSPPTVND